MRNGLLALVLCGCAMVAGCATLPDQPVSSTSETRVSNVTVELGGWLGGQPRWRGPDWHSAPHCEGPTCPFGGCQREPRHDDGHNGTHYHG